jgi:hypothetical protein
LSIVTGKKQLLTNNKPKISRKPELLTTSDRKKL